MKTFFKIILLISFFTINAQQAPILDYTWTIEKIFFQSDNETVYADTNFFDQYEVLYLESYETTYTLNYVILGSGLSFDNSNQSFDMIDPSVLTENPEEGIADIGNLFMFNFCVELNSPPKNPFYYDFREEGDLIYLDITNSEGDVATFWASTLSSSNFEASYFSIFPNPASNELRIQTDNTTVKHIEIFNLSGKRVLKSTYNSNVAMDVSSLAKGLYVLKIETETGIFTKKLVKE